MDDNVLKQFEGMPGVTNNTSASTSGISETPAETPRTAPATFTPTQLQPQQKPIPRTADAPVPVEVREFPQIAQTPRVVRPAPQNPVQRTTTEFKAIVPDPIFAHTDPKNSAPKTQVTRLENQENNQDSVALETLGRNSIAQPFANIPRKPIVPPGPTAASAFRAATETPQQTPLTPRATQTLSESQFAQPTQIPENNTATNDPNVIESLRTYERDMAQSIRGGETVFSINRAAQQKNEARARERREISEATEIITRNSLKTIVSLVLILGAIATFGIVFFVYRNNAPVPQIAIERTIISVDTTRDIQLSATNRAGIISATQKELASTAAAPQSLTRLQLLDRGITDLGSAREISAQDFLSAVATNIPAALIRALGNEWLFGFHAQKKNEPFLIVDIGAFDNTYSGMLRWEANMPADLGDIFLVNNVMPVATTTQSATSTSATVSTTTRPTVEKINTVQIPLKKQFEDVVVKSRDTRMLKNAQGNSVLLYSFIDTKYIVITTNEDTFREIIDRYLASGLVR